MVNIFLYYNYAPFLMLQAYIMPLTLSKMKFEKKKKNCFRVSGDGRRKAMNSILKVKTQNGAFSMVGI
jgi:hypothetical protein